MVLGEDQFNNLYNWHNVDFILNNVEIICFKRENTVEKNGISSNVNIIDFDFPFSSEQIRKKVKMKESIHSNIVDEQVLNYIKEHGLYI